MAGKTKQENKTPGHDMAPDAGQENTREPAADAGTKNAAEPVAGAGVQKTFYRIICENPISKSFGGVTFVNGEACTADGFTASWFRNKKGYTVIKEQAQHDSECTGCPGTAGGENSGEGGQTENKCN